MKLLLSASALWLASLCAAAEQPTPPGGAVTCDSLASAHFEFGGPVGERVRANLENWLLRAPEANPGMLEMFRMRDREPAPQLVPWAGEFIGKYLLSAVPALRMSDDPRLPREVARVVRDFIGTQADDGYLGPFPRKERLLRNWDLWGHYHALLALTLWQEHTGDPSALAAARKAADLVCRTYLDTDRRVFDAGDCEMNMAILTGLARLHRITGEPRYLRLAREVEQDWERAGDYLRAGLDGREFYRSPRPRWESLHDLQGLGELWRITGDTRYRDAFEHHWRSIRRWDYRNTGGFSSGEQATGNPYAPTAVETCCTVAWTALTIDHLRLTGDPRAADDLELTLLNGGLGAQHPSGRWWTYNTPMDGVREASAHTIVFQARAGTPELNCCSVNGPRVLGMLSEWALMTNHDGLVLNWLGAGRFTATLANGQRVTLTSSADAWREGRTELRVNTSKADALSLLVRIPSWADGARATLNGRPVRVVGPGRYLELHRRWSAKDRLELELPPRLRFVAGANEAAGKVSLYRGPLLLAFDQAANLFDEQALPELDLARLGATDVVLPARPATVQGGLPPPWLEVSVPTVDGRPLRLVDFANAGARGTRYRSWLAARPMAPAPAFTQVPTDGARVRPGPVGFQWRGARSQSVSYRVEISSSEAFVGAPAWSTNVTGTRLTLDTSLLPGPLANAGARLWWRVNACGAGGETVASVPPAWFMLDPAAAPQLLPAEPVRGPHGELLVHSLRNGARPAFGTLVTGPPAESDAEGTGLNGRDQRIVYAMPFWPEGDFTVGVRVQIKEHPRGRIGQIFSGWAAGMDDPLRLVVDGGRLFARVEAGGVFSTPGVTIDTDRWYAVAAVKRGAVLRLYLDGREAGSCGVPEFLSTRAEDCALGGNPHFGGNEFLAARFADFCFYDRALSVDELRSLARGP